MNAPNVFSSIPYLALTTLVFALAAAPSVGAKDDHDHDHDHGAHVHGAVTLNVALEGEVLVAETDAPALHVVGFEHAPRSQAERDAIVAADRWLASGRDILGVPRSANCRLDKVDYSPPKLDGGHADYRARHTFRCTRPSELTWVELWSLRRLRGVEEAQVNLITPSGQRQLKLTPGTLRVSLR